MNIRSSQLASTPYQKIKQSKVGRLVRDNKLGTAATTVAASAVLAGGSFQSEAFANLTRYTILPAAGLGVAAVGASAVHDAVVNDIGENNLRATTKIALGTAAALGGTQIVGLAYDIPILDQALTGPLFEHGQGLVGAGLIGGAALAGRTAFNQFNKAGESENKAVPLALGTGAAVGAVGAGLAGAEMIGKDLDLPVLDRALTGTVEFLSRSNASAIAGGGLLMAGAAVAGTQAARSLLNQDGNNAYTAAALTSGALAGGLGGLELAGHGLGLEATKGLFTQNAPLIGGLSLSAVGGAATQHSINSLRENGATLSNAFGLTAGTTALVGGLSLAASSLEAGGLANVLTHGTGVTAGLGLGLGAFAFGKNAVESAQKGRVATATLHGAGALASVAGGLTALGYGLEIEALKNAGADVTKRALEPLVEHVISPTLQYLFENPVVGGIGLAAVVGGYAYTQLKD